MCQLGKAWAIYPGLEPAWSPSRARVVQSVISRREDPRGQEAELHPVELHESFWIRPGVKTAVNGLFGAAAAVE